MSKGENKLLRVATLLVVCIMCGCALASSAQKRTRAAHDEAEFGPIVRAYLGYLRAQQEVVDDRVSRREVSPAYYRRNSNRIRALRQMAIRIARETNNDYLPELEAVTFDELNTLFETLPRPEALHVGEVFDYTLRFLGTVGASREKFYLFARLDPYEQVELRKQSEAQPSSDIHPAPVHSSSSSSTVKPIVRPRRVSVP